MGPIWMIARVKCVLRMALGQACQPAEAAGWLHGQTRRLRAAGTRGARRTFRAPVVHRRARLAEVRRRRAGRARRRVQRGDRLRRIRHRRLRSGLRSRHAREARPRTFQILPWRGERPATARMFCDIEMPDGSPSYADPRFVLKRTLGRAAEPRVHLLHPPRDRVLSAQGPARVRRGAGARRPQRLFRPHLAVGLPTTSGARPSRCSSRWASRSSSATTRAARGSKRSTFGTPMR